MRTQTGSAFTTRFAVALIFSALVFGNSALAAGELTYCGSVKAYLAPTATQVGSVSLGTRVYAIAAGTVVPSQMTQVTGSPGGALCVTGITNDQGQFVSIQSAHPYGAVGAAGITYSICGTVASYQDPQGPSAGVLRFQDGRETLVPSGTIVSAEARSGYHCFDGGINPSGDAIVTGLGQVAGPAASQPAALPITLPATGSDAPAAPVGAILAIGGVGLASLLMLFLRRRSA
jgi:hypothetical protein